MYPSLNVISYEKYNFPLNFSWGTNRPIETTGNRGMHRKTLAVILTYMLYTNIYTVIIVGMTFLEFKIPTPFELFSC